MNEFKSTPISQNGEQVLTTAQLAEAYKTTEKRISENFNRNKNRFIEGKHFYCLKGEELEKFLQSANCGTQNINKVRVLYLWTERGTLLHAKSLNTKKAWEVYVFLMENYFHTRQMMTPYDNTSMQIIENQLNALNNSLIQIIENQKAVQKQIDTLNKRLDVLEKKSDDIIDSDNHIIIPFIKGIINKLK